MENKLIKYVAFAEYEDWKKDLVSLLGDEPTWMEIKDNELISKLEKMLDEDFMPSVYRIYNGKWEVDAIHAYYNQLPKELQKESYGFADKAVYQIENLNKVSRDRRVVRCLKYAQAIVNALPVACDGDFERLIKHINYDKQQRYRKLRAYNFNGALVYGGLDSEETAYAKVFGMSKEDKKDYDELKSIKEAKERIKLKENGSLDYESIVVRGEKVIPPYLHGLWERYCNIYINRDPKTLLASLQVLESLDRGESINNIAQKLDRDNFLQLEILIRFAPNGKDIVKQLGISVIDSERE